MRPPARWALAPVLALAAARERAARCALGEALADVATRRRDEALARDALRAHRAATAALAGRDPGAAAPPAGALAALALQAARRADDERRLTAALRRWEAGHAAALDEAERRRAALGEARAAVRALEARRQAWSAARARDRERASEDERDDLVSARRRGGG